jgi:hypothetical protein
VLSDDVAYVHSWLFAFCLTLAVETPIVYAFYRRVERPIRLLGLILFANLATHPAVWFIFPRLPLPYARQVFASEVWAFGLEIIFYHLAFPGSLRRAALAAITANAASLIAGYAWLHFVGHF